LQTDAILSKGGEDIKMKIQLLFD